MALKYLTTLGLLTTFLTQRALCGFSDADSTTSSLSIRSTEVQCEYKPHRARLIGDQYHFTLSLPGETWLSRCDAIDQALWLACGRDPVHLYFTHSPSAQPGVCQPRFSLSYQNEPNPLHPDVDWKCVKRAVNCFEEVDLDCVRRELYHRCVYYKTNIETEKNRVRRTEPFVGLD